MRPTGWVSLVAVIGLCVGCADPTLATEADGLRAEVAGLPGVTSTRLEYHEPVSLDSGKLALDVQMVGTATPDQVAAVAEAAYGGFNTTHQGEEADLSIRVGRTTVALRSFEPDASSAAVGTAVRAGLEVAPDAGSVAIDLTTDGVTAGDHVAGTYLVTLPEGSTFLEVPDLLAMLAEHRPDNPQIGWGVAAADGSSLSYESGFPPQPLVGRWARIQRVELPMAVRATTDGALFLEGRLTRRFDVADPGDHRALDRITHGQLRALGDGPWSYTLLGPQGAYLADIDRFGCAPPVSEGPYDDELDAWAVDEFGPCEPD